MRDLPTPCSQELRPPNGLMLSRVAAPPSSGATRSVARTERRKPRASERRYVGSCNELGGDQFRAATLRKPDVVRI